MTLITWLRGHGLRNGLASYWQAGAVSLESGEHVQMRTADVKGSIVTPYYWETNMAWYDPSHYYANFVLAIINEKHQVTAGGVDSPSAYERVFGRPASTHIVGNVEVLIYHKNLLKQVQPGKVPTYG